LLACRQALNLRGGAEAQALLLKRLLGQAPAYEPDKQSPFDFLQELLGECRRRKEGY
jgi:hypothetical protein